MTIKEKVLSDDGLCQIVLLGDSGVLKFSHKGFVTVDKLIETGNQILEEIRKYQIKKVIANSSEMKVLTKEHQEYITKNWTGNFIKLGGRKIASILPKDIFGRMGLSSVAQTIQSKNGDTVEYAVFDNVQEAEEWTL